jgi:outer membrane protein OmpA-like peptidoglycan-associated protein
VSRTHSRFAWIAGPILFLAAACAPVPKPSVLAELDRIHDGAAAAEAKTYAPDAFARAEKLRGESTAAFDAGDNAGAQLLAERAIAAYSRALALSRIARAQETQKTAESALAKSDAELAALDADQARVGADADALELKVKVTRDAQPIQPSGKADPEREKARLLAARALAMQARLLCGGARLLAATAGTDAKLAAQVDEAEAALAKVEGELAGTPAATPIDGATRARAGCLAALTAIRRAGAPVSRAPGQGDALLAEISAIGKFEPARDDRGVAVALRGVFAGGGDKLTPAGEAKLAELGKIAAAHTAFPIVVVLHTDKSLSDKEEAAQRPKAEAALAALKKAAGQAVRAQAFVAGNRAPLVDPGGPDKARNARLEIVFVTPEGF